MLAQRWSGYLASLLWLELQFFMQELVVLVYIPCAYLIFSWTAEPNLLHLHCMPSSIYSFFPTPLETTIQIQTHNPRCSKQMFPCALKQCFSLFPTGRMVDGKFFHHAVLIRWLEMA